jgi:hypothetical protein
MAPTVRVDEEVYEQLKTHAEPFVDTPNSVLRRLLGLTSTDEVEEEDIPAETPGQGPLLTSVSTVAPVTGKGAKTSSRSPSRKTRGKRTRVASGTLLAEEQYEVPLLTALIELGGSAPSREVIELVGKKLADRLTDADKATLNSGGIRWRSRVQFVRLRMIEQGLMLKETGRGIWAISDAGRDQIARQKTGVA